MTSVPDHQGGKSSEPGARRLPFRFSFASSEWRILPLWLSGSDPGIARLFRLGESLGMGWDSSPVAFPSVVASPALRRRRLTYTARLAELEDCRRQDLAH